MYTYTFTTASGSTEIPLKKDTLQGIYSAQILASMYTYLGGSNSDVAMIGNEDGHVQDGRTGDYGFTLTHNHERESIIRTKDLSDRFRMRANIPVQEYVNPDDYPVAYSQALQNALVFKAIAADIVGDTWDQTKTLYHTVLNFDSGNENILFSDAFDHLFDQVMYGDDREIETIPEELKQVFSQPGDNEVSSYYIGITPDARNTAMIKLGTPAEDGAEWVKGVCLFFKWATDAGYVHHYADRQKSISKPALYLYIYNNPVALINAKDPATMESQLPNVIYRLTY